MKQERRGWFIIGLLFAAGAINYLDRSALSILASLVSKDLNLRPSQLGLVFATFSIGYALFCFLGGMAADRLGPKKVFTWATLSWSVFCGLTGAVTGFGGLLVVRALFGASEGPFISTANKVVSNWFGPRQRATAFAVANSGQPLGSAAAGPIVTILAATYNWRLAFLAIAIIGVVWVFAWIFVARDRPEPTGDSKITAPEPHRRATPIRSSERLSFYLRQPTIAATAIALFAYFYVLFFFLTWFPPYLTMSLKLSLARMGLFTTLPWIAGFFGYLCGGMVSDYVFKMTGNLILARKVVMVASLSTSAICIALVASTSNLTTVLTLLCLAVFALYLSGNTYFVIVIDTVEASCVGAVTGFVHMVGIAAGIVAPALTGFLVEYSGTFVSAFLITGAIAICGALAALFFIRAKVNRPALAT
jgi:sugar phosphate permease